MRILSFSELWKVNAILSRPNIVTQTIRPLFCKDCVEVDTDLSKPFCQPPEHGEHKPIHKVGDDVKLVYKQRVLKSGDYFCTKCGEIAPVDVDKEDGLIIARKHSRHHGYPIKKWFATVKMNDVFEIEMGNRVDIGKIKPVYDDLNWVNRINPPVEKVVHSSKVGFAGYLAKRDGFKSAEEMFQWFGRRYNLYKSPKHFVVYRWKLLWNYWKAENNTIKNGERNNQMVTGKNTIIIRKLKK